MHPKKNNSRIREYNVCLSLSLKIVIIINMKTLFNYSLYTVIVFLGISSLIEKVHKEIIHFCSCILVSLNNLGELKLLKIFPKC